MPPTVLFDNVTLSHFACVGRLDLLERRYGYRAGWTEAVHDEAYRAVNGARVAYMQDVLDASWLRDPIEPPRNRKERTELTRLHIGLNDGVRPPIEHLGEAESIYWSKREGFVFATDDAGASSFARARGVATLDTVQMLRDCRENAEVGCPEAWGVLQQMLSAGRSVREARHEDVCPRGSAF